MKRRNSADGSLHFGSRSRPPHAKSSAHLNGCEGAAKLRFLTNSGDNDELIPKKMASVGPLLSGFAALNGVCSSDESRGNSRDWQSVRGVLNDRGVVATGDEQRAREAGYPVVEKPDFTPIFFGSIFRPIGARGSETTLSAGDEEWVREMLLEFNREAARLADLNRSGEDAKGEDPRVQSPGDSGCGDELTRGRTLRAYRPF